jgi:glycosyltransferase involved in cell wall biosynthesis
MFGGRMKKISIVVPCYNESSGIASFVQEISGLVISLPSYQFEVIFIDDGSTDDSLLKIKKLCGIHGWLCAVSLTRNFGKEAALTAGLDFATGDAVVFMDADLQHPPIVVKSFLEKWEQGECVVVGRRKSRQTDSGGYRFFAEHFYRLHNRISDIQLPENVGDFRLIDRKVVNQLKMLRENRRFMKGLFAWVGYQPFYVDYIVAARSHGSSTFNKWRSWNFALEGITSFSTVPLRIWSYLGVAVLSIGLAYSFAIVVDALVHGVATPGYVTLLTAIVVFGGIQLIGIGVLGEYIGRIYMEVKGRPSYLIDEVIGNTVSTIKVPVEGK